MSEFKPMVKMHTDEPSVILKLKKGGHVDHKKHHHSEHGHKSMHKAMGGLMSPSPAMIGKMPGMRKAKPVIPGVPAPVTDRAPMKKGGGVKSNEHKAEMKEMHKIEKELKKHEHKKASAAHHGLKHGGKVGDEHIGHGGKKVHDGLKHGGSHHHGVHKKHHHKDGGAITASMHKTTEKDSAARAYLQDKHVTTHPDSVKGISKTPVKEGNAGGYKKGGHVSHGHDIQHNLKMMKHHMSKHHETGSAHHKKMAAHFEKMCYGGAMHKKTGGTVSDSGAKNFLQTKHVSDEHMDPVHGTSKTPVKEGNAGGFKHGGSTHHGVHKKHHHADGGHIKKTSVPGGGVKMNVVTAKPGVSNAKTGDVREGNAGGFKHGGHAKKHFKTGGSVESGAPVKMPQGRKKPEAPVSIDRLSGTFKRGGHVK